MYSFENVTTAYQYQLGKRSNYVSFEDVPNTAQGYESCCKYVNANGFRYFLSANNEKDYFLMCDERGTRWAVWFTVDGDTITVIKSTYNGRSEKNAKYHKKYASILALIHSCIKYDGVVKYVTHCGM